MLKTVSLTLVFMFLFLMGGLKTPFKGRES